MWICAICLRKHITNDSERGSRASYCRCNIDYQQIENYKICICKLKEQRLATTRFWSNLSRYTILTSRRKIVLANENWFSPIMSKASIFIIHLFPIFKACNYRIWSSPELNNIRTITIVLRSQWFIRGQINLPLFGFKILFSSFTHSFCFLLNNIFF